MTALWDRLRLFNIREFSTHKGRTAASVTVVAVSAALLVAVLGISGSVTGSIDQLSGGVAGDADVEVSGITEAGFPESLGSAIAAVPGVRSASAMIRTSVGPRAESNLLVGVDPRGGQGVQSELASVASRYLGAMLSTPRSVLVGPAVGYAAGDMLPVRQSRVTVAAVVDDSAAASLNGGHFILAPLWLVQQVLDRKDQVDSVLIRTAPGTDVAAVKASVTEVVAGRAVVGDPTLRAAQTGRGIMILRYMSVMGASVAFIVAAFLIYSAMGMAITQRRPVISMLRAIGGHRRTIVGDLLAEAATLGLIGGLIGAVLGVVMGSLAIDQLPNAMLQGVDARIEYHVPWIGIPIAIAAAILVSVAASAVAARQVYKVAPIEALAPVGVSTADVVRPLVRVAAGLVSLALAAGMMVCAVGHWGIVSAAAALALGFGASIVACYALTDQIVALAARVASVFGPPGALAAATIRRSPRRVWATLMTVSIAVAMTVAINASNDNAISSAQDSFRTLAEPDLWVSAQPADSFPVGPILPAGLEATVAALPGVQRVIPGQLAFASLSGQRVLLFGLGQDSSSPLYHALSSDKLRRQLTNGEGVVLSRDVGKSLGVTAGDTLTMDTPSGPRRVVVLELVSYFSALTGSVAMNLDNVRDWFARPGSTTLEVRATPGVDTAALQADLRRVTPSDVYVFTGPESLEGVSGAMRQGMAIANAIWIIVVIIATVALLNTLMLSVLERRRELGVLRAIGSSRRFSLRMILAEAAGIGLVGGALGLAIGLANQYLYDYTSTEILGIDVAFTLTTMTAVFGGGAIALTLLGSIPPAVRAARINIIDAVSIE